MAKKKDKILTGRKATLLAQGCEIRDEIKVLEGKLKDVQKAINLRSTGNFVTDDGFKLRITEKKVMSKICPRLLFKYFRGKGRPSTILEVVTVNLTALKEVMPGEDIEDFQDELVSNKSWTWSA